MILTSDVIFTYMVTMRVRKNTLWKEEMDKTLLQLLSYGFHDQILLKNLPIQATLRWKRPPPGLEALSWDHMRVPLFLWMSCLGISFVIFLAEQIYFRRWCIFYFCNNGL